MHALDLFLFAHSRQIEMNSSLIGSWRTLEKSIRHPKKLSLQHLLDIFPFGWCRCAPLSSVGSVGSQRGVADDLRSFGAFPVLERYLLFSWTDSVFHLNESYRPEFQCSFNRLLYLLSMTQKRGEGRWFYRAAYHTLLVAHEFRQIDSCSSCTRRANFPCA